MKKLKHRMPHKVTALTSYLRCVALGHVYGNVRDGVGPGASSRVRDPRLTL
jgi:hypothetical protein